MLVPLRESAGNRKSSRHNPAEGCPAGISKSSVSSPPGRACAVGRSPKRNGGTGRADSRIGVREWSFSGEARDEEKSTSVKSSFSELRLDLRPAAHPPSRDHPSAGYPSPAFDDSRIWPLSASFRLTFPDERTPSKMEACSAPTTADGEWAPSGKAGASLPLNW